MLRKYVLCVARPMRVLMIGVVVAGLLAGCGGKKNAGQQATVVPVKAMQVVQKDTPVVYEFVGEIEAKDQVQIQSKVSGMVVDKMISGGASVQQGQPLFQIDRRTYEGDVLSKQGALAQAQAALTNAKRDLLRARVLYAKDAIAQAQLDQYVMAEAESQAQVEAASGALRISEANLADTLIVSPLEGRIDTKDVSIGTYIQMGNTVLTTVSDLDPVRVKFSISENDYLAVARTARNRGEKDEETLVTLILGDGSKYGITGHVEQVDRGISQQTGTLTLKAIFANPQFLLMPGMFARTQVVGDVRKGALLIPQRALQEMLGKNFVTVVAEGDKAERRSVKTGPKIGNMIIIEEGLNSGERVVVEGFQKAQPGTALKVTMMTEEEIAANKN
ncbi:MAG TPA: efflux RND transporter periplasmic adaptor subunit [Patescibacteria group bacterium]|nr:efflux RND transporter periplasmic adaptor subunit [Patescibacteria group bacterium]